ncbi:hypothetical protein D3C73_670630 [compost metagenome]
MRIEGERHRGIEAGVDTRCVGEARAVAAGQRAYIAIGTDHPDAVVPGIGHVHLSLRIHGDAHRSIETRLRGGTIGEALLATSQRRHLSIGADAPDRMIAGVGHIQIALCIGGNARRSVETRLQGRSINTSLALPRYRFDTAIGQAAADAVVVTGIGEIDAAIGTAQQRVGVGEACLRRGAIAITRMTVAGQQLDLCGPSQRRG